MRSFKKLFGFGKKEKTLTIIEAIQELKNTSELLMKKQEHLENKIDHELKTAKQSGTKNKRVALQALKRKKRYEKQLQEIDNTLSTIEMQQEALESSTTNTNVLKTMNEAAQALKSAHNQINVDKIHETIEDIGEQLDVAQEISEAISNPISYGQDVDDDDLLAELEELEKEIVDKALLKPSVSVPSVLPEVPKTVPIPVNDIPAPATLAS